MDNDRQYDERHSLNDQKKKKKKKRAESHATDTGTDFSLGIADNHDANVAIRSLEADVQAKNRARSARSSRAAGAVSETGGSQTHSKASGRSLQSSNSARAEARTLSEQQAALVMLEEDLQAKNRSRTAEPIYVDPGQDKASYGAHGRKDYSATMGTGYSDDNLHSPVTGSKDFLDEDPDKYSPGENGNVEGYDGQGDGMNQDAIPQEGPRQGQPSFGTNQDEENVGVVAELAPNQVIDPYAITVLPSDEEEALAEKKRCRRYLCFASLGLLAVAAAIIIPVVVIFTKPPKPIVPTAAPSLAPTGVPSTSPSTSRLADIFEFAATLSDPQTLLDITSPQYRAASWLADEDELVIPLESTQRLVQRYALAVFYFSTGGDGWEECYREDTCVVGFSWLSGDQNECLWHGVRCTSSANTVQKILIGNEAPLGNNQDGTLPSELSLLTDLQSLVLISGKIRGTIPTELGLLSNLQSLFLQDQLLNGTIPDQIIQNCLDLQMLAIGSNLLTGPIPTSIASLPKLLDLQLWGNNFTGTLPTEFGTLSTSINNFEFQLNNLNGTIPESIFNMLELRTLTLEDNNFGGTISESLGKLTLLRTFEVSGNNLVGSLPESIYTMPSLQNIRVGNNGLSGPLSERLRELNATLLEFNAPNNDFTGTLPMALSLLTNLNKLFLHGNNIGGAVSSSLCSAGLVNLTMPVTVDCSGAVGCCDLQA